MRNPLWPLLLLSTLCLGQAPAQGTHPPRLQINDQIVEAWPAGASTFVESPGLSLNVGTPYVHEIPGADGYRLLSLVVQPGEKLTFKLKSEEEKVTLQAYIPEPPPASLDWRLALKNANLPRPVSRTHLTIQNTTTEPQTLVLMILGKHGYWYRVDLQR